MTQTARANYLKEVREQYEQYPYPTRVPEDELKRFEYPHHAALDVMYQYHFAGRPDFLKNFRVLIAGGGTGDAAMIMGEQLRGTDAEIIHLDISQASMEIAKQRASIRGLTNISWVHGSLLDVAKLTQGKFDYIDCSGVLHHLAKPEDGLAALESVLKEDGVMGLMLYARYGREMIYRMQSLMKLINVDEEDMQQRVENCKTVIYHLRDNPMFSEVRTKFGYELKHYGDNAIYDMFLHSHDVSYTIPEVHRFLAGSGLKLSHFFFNQQKQGNDSYKPETYVYDAKMLKTYAHMSEIERQATAELMHSQMIKHTFYATRSTTQVSVPDPGNLSLVPYFNMLLGDNEGTYQSFRAMFDQPGDAITVKVIWIEAQIPRTKHGKQIFEHMDGKRTLAEIFELVRKETNASHEDLLAEFAKIYKSLNKFDLLLLKEPAVPARRSLGQIMKELRDRQ